MKIGFLNNQIDNRGTGNAVYNYAHYNEVILGNESKIFTFPNGAHDEGAIDAYTSRFGAIYIPDDSNLRGLDALYHIKSGENDGFKPSHNIKYLVHAVFHPEPHGDVIATISEWMGIRDNLPYVPHIVELPDVQDDFRAALKIPDNAVVFGRHGGFDSFDIGWAWEAVQYCLEQSQNTYFLFVNTPTVIKHERIFYFPPTSDRKALKGFINTCNAMLHARTRGETFGIAVGEFASQGKHIITYADSYEKAHIYELRGTALTYNDSESLSDILLNYSMNVYPAAHPFYDKFTPEKVMEQFQRVFLDENSWNRD